ncbi:MAG TPA: hypothetical protein VN521_07665 [Negativicutes bacterium]|nr:hypothetical protein [Negativicutes bacterium]
MLKLCISLGVALVVAVLTATVGWVQGARPLTVLYRAMITFAGFSLVGYLAGLTVDGYLRRRLADVKPKRQSIDIISKDGIIENDELLNPAHASPQFSPLSPDNFEQLTTKDQV